MTEDDLISPSFIAADPYQPKFELARLRLRVCGLKMRDYTYHRPWYYGYAYKPVNQDAYVFYVIPLNKLVVLGRFLYQWLVFPSRLSRLEYMEHRLDSIDKKLDEALNHSNRT